MSEEQKPVDKIEELDQVDLIHPIIYFSEDKIKLFNGFAYEWITITPDLMRTIINKYIEY